VPAGGGLRRVFRSRLGTTFWVLSSLLTSFLTFLWQLLVLLAKRYRLLTKRSKREVDRDLRRRWCCRNVDSQFYWKSSRSVGAVFITM
jgi:hypothetical protein